MSTIPSCLIGLIAFWPVWRWQFLRFGDGSDEPWGVLALATVIILLFVKGKVRVPNRWQITGTCVMTLLYAASYDALPPLMRAVIAMSALGFLLSAYAGSSRLDVALLGLLILSLPLISSLQFYLGYPVRLVTAQLAAHAISTAGYSVQAHGTILSWMGEMVVVDAPCAGIRMLWSGLYLTFTLSLLREFRFILTWIAYTSAVVLIFTGNVIRNIILFFTESGIVKAPPWAHSFIGMVCLGLVLGAICLTHQYLGKKWAQT